MRKSTSSVSPTKAGANSPNIFAAPDGSLSSVIGSVPFLLSHLAGAGQSVAPAAVSVVIAWCRCCRSGVLGPVSIVDRGAV